MTLGKYFELKQKSVGVELVLTIISLFMMMFAVYYTSPDRQLDLEAFPFYQSLLDCISNLYLFTFGEDDFTLLTQTFAFPDLFFGISSVFTLTFSIVFLLQQKSFGLHRNGTFMTFHIFSIVYSVSILLTNTTYLPIVYIFIKFYYLRLLYQDVKAESSSLSYWFGTAVFTELTRCVLLILAFSEGSLGEFVWKAFESYTGLIIFYYACKVVTAILFYNICGKLVYHKKPAQPNAV